MISDRNINMYTQKRTVLEPDLTHTIAEVIKTNISSSASDVFRTNKTIVGVKDNIHPVQMVIINKWFRELLLIAKSSTATLNVVDVLMCIEDDCLAADWVKLYTVAIIPFIRKNNILA